MEFSYLLLKTSKNEVTAHPKLIVSSNWTSFCHKELLKRRKKTNNNCRYLTLTRAANRQCVRAPQNQVSNLLENKALT